MAEPEAPDVPLLASIYLFEALAGLALIGAYRNGGLDGLWSLSTPHSQRFVAGVVGTLAAGWFIATRYRRRGPEATKRFWMTAGLNLVTVSLLAASSEIAIRLIAREAPGGTVFMGTTLLPRDWPAIADRNRSLLAKRPANISYFVADELLGWTIGPSRESSDGLYASSAEGLRSASAGVRLADRAGARRVALVGDSYTFGLEVPYERSWGHLVEAPLGSDVQILNFGVDGYGVDQSYLRYHRDVRPWHPELVAFGFINQDFYRNMTVYTFVDFPEWGFPFSKPRFVAGRDGALKLLNVPLIPPETIFDKASVTELPHLALDRGYREEEWRRRWYHHSYLLRFLQSRFAPDPVLPADVSDEARESLSAQLLTTVLDEAAHEGSKAILLFFPSRADFEPNGKQTTAHDRVKAAVFSALRAKGVEVADLTACLASMDPRTMFLPGRPHYSAAGNAAAAACVLPILERELAKQEPFRNPPSR